MVSKITSQSEFDNIYKTAKPLAVIHFSADFVEQCSFVNSYLTELSQEEEIKNSNVKFYEIAAEDFPEASLKCKITAAPTILYVVEGVIKDVINGVKTIETREKIFDHLNLKASEKSLNDRLKELINRHKVMVFMKGDRLSPRCGFSRTLMEILCATGIDFDTFDILQDEEVRQGLKTYSEWPTYPQVYVKGELLGGLDIIKELKESNQLEDELKGL